MPAGSIGRQIAATAIGIGDAGGDFNPVAGRVVRALRAGRRSVDDFDPAAALKSFEPHSDARGGLAQHSVQYMR